MRGKLIKIVLATVILIVSSLVVSRVFFVWMVRVPTGAMSNTIVPDDHVVIKKVVGSVERGSLIIYKWPKDPSVLYVGRVIGLPGETIEIGDRSVLINGNEIPEQRVTVKPEEVTGPPGPLSELSSEGSGPYRVFYQPRDANGLVGFPADMEVPFGKVPLRIPDDEYFVMGDNRDNSLDSRFWGTVTRDAIVGKPNMIYWSYQRDRSGNQQVRWERLFTKVR